MAQVYAPRDVPRRHKFKYDLIYIKNRSFWLDLKLIALSFWITLRGKWESREKKFWFNVQGSMSNVQSPRPGQNVKREA